MTKEYDISIHGDVLELNATNFIREQFPAYEQVWKTYIGNKGPAVRADLPNYPDENKRMKFSEHTYTILEALFISFKILEDEKLEQPITHFDTYMDFTIYFMAFISQLGRAKDNLTRACQTLIGENTSCNELEAQLKPIYNSRNIILHGRKLPYSIDEIQMVNLPIFFSNKREDPVWDDKINMWEDAEKHGTKYAETSCNDIFKELVKIANKAFYKWYEIIADELKKFETELTFEFTAPQIPPISSSTINAGVSGHNHSQEESAASGSYIVPGASGRSGTEGISGSSGNVIR